MDIPSTNSGHAVLMNGGSCDEQGPFFCIGPHRQEVEALRADVKQKELGLSKDYVTEWRTYIAEPLQREVGELRNEVAALRNAIQKIDACPHRDGKSFLILLLLEMPGRGRA